MIQSNGSNGFPGINAGMMKGQMATCQKSPRKKGSRRKVRTRKGER